MCMFIRKENFEVKVATEDLKCYKIVEEDVASGYPCYISEYQRYIYRKGVHYKQNTEFSAAVENPNTAYGFYREDILFIGVNPTELETRFGKRKKEAVYEFKTLGRHGFHSFESIAKEHVYGNGFVAIECKIPKGSRYVVGFDGVTSRTAYFSEELYVVGEKRFA